MHSSVQRLNSIKLKINEVLKKKQPNNFIPKIIAVSKTFTISDILPVVESGHIHFGENKVQEAEGKWPEIKIKFKEIKLHMIGRLQSNKVKKAVKIFDYIHTVDSAKIAEKIAKHEKELNKKIKLFIQVNIGNEKLKSGVSTLILNDLFNYCTKKLSLNIIGLMCLPPKISNVQEYFSSLKELAKKLNLNELSMGMSDDYLKALNYNATYLRLGTSVFGSRNT